MSVEGYKSVEIKNLPKIEEFFYYNCSRFNKCQEMPLHVIFLKMLK